MNNMGSGMKDTSFFRNKIDNLQLNGKPTTNYTAKKIVPTALAASTVLTAAVLIIGGVSNLFGKKS